MSVIEDFTLVRDFCLSGTFVGLKNMISGVFGGPLVAFEQNLRDLFNLRTFKRMIFLSKLEVSK